MGEICLKCGSTKTSIVGTNPNAYECENGHVFIKSKNALIDE